MERTAAPRLQTVLIAPVTGRIGETFGGTSKELRRDDKGDVNTSEGIELLDGEGYNRAGNAGAIFGSAGIDMTDPVGLCSSSGLCARLRPRRLGLNVR
jgi:hypothetical protein